MLGAVDDAAKWSPTPGRIMSETHDSGFDAVVLTAVWKQGAQAETDLPPLRKAARAAAAHNVEPLIDIYQQSADTPSTPDGRTAFAQYAAALVRALPSVHQVMIGNEPNLNLFWMPQFGTDGSDTAAADYEALLATTYDALKAVNPSLTVIGGNLSPHGGDVADTSRPTHSPTKFIEDMGAAYQASGRKQPLMDEFSIHVYGESPRIPPTLAHPNTTSIGIADYAKLRALLQSAFGGSLPIVYGEYGVETTVPADKQKLYSGREVVPTVDAQVQAHYYRQAVEMARKQSDVRGLFIFKVFDETRLEGLQSGVRYTDGSPKPSLAVVQQLGSSG
jgi:hypothetical protein